MADRELVTEIERRELGKKKKLWRMEVIYNDRDTGAAKRHFADNLTQDEMMVYREKLFSIGIMLPVEPGHWIAVAPWKITELHLWRQDKFFEP
jgi:hypothetical protein